MFNHRSPANTARQNQKRSRRATPRKLAALTHRAQLETLEQRAMLTGTWTPLTNLMPTSNNQVPIGSMQLLSDGSVMVADYNAQAWLKLTPNATGNYAAGTWNALANMSTPRLYTETSMVLPDGRFLYLGGKYSGSTYSQNYTNTGEIYDPSANTWTSITTFPESSFGNTPGVVLNDGTVLVGSKTSPNTYLYHPTTNTWTSGPTKLDGDPSWGESWIKLPGGDVLTIDAWNNAGDLERLDPATMTWSDAGMLPADMQGPGTTLGADMQLPDGRIFVEYGGYSLQAKIALYDPATNSWTDGIDVPGGLAGKNIGAAMLTSGHVLFNLGTPGGGPVHIFEAEGVRVELTRPGTRAVGDSTVFGTVAVAHRLTLAS